MMPQVGGSTPYPTWQVVDKVGTQNSLFSPKGKNAAPAAMYLVHKLCFVHKII